MGAALFVVLAVLTVVAASTVVLHPNPVKSALALVVTLFLLAVVFVLLEAHMIAALQIIVYAGAIMVLFLFVVMLLNAPHEETEYDERVHPLLQAGPMRFGAFLAAALMIELVWALMKGGGESGAFPGKAVSGVKEIGQLLFTDYAFPFEVTSILILVAMVGAVVLARREGPR